MTGPEWSPVKACRRDGNGQIISHSKYSLCSTAALGLWALCGGTMKSILWIVNSPNLDSIVFSVKSVSGVKKEWFFFSFLHTHESYLHSYVFHVCDFSTGYHHYFCFLLRSMAMLSRKRDGVITNMQMYCKYGLVGARHTPHTKYSPFQECDPHFGRGHAEPKASRWSTLFYSLNEQRSSTIIRAIPEHRRHLKTFASHHLIIWSNSESECPHIVCFLL